MSARFADTFAQIFAKCLVSNPDSAKNIFVFYHKPCRDGRMSRIVLEKYIRESCGYNLMENEINVTYGTDESDKMIQYYCGDNKIQFFGIDPRSMKIPDMEEIKDSVVFVLDICYDNDVTKTMIMKSMDLLVIDHHKYNEMKLTDIPEKNKIFSDTSCASMLLWKAANPNETVPQLLQFIDDHDCFRPNRTDESKASKLLFDHIEKNSDDEFQIDARYWRYLEDDALLQSDISEQGMPLLEKYNKDVVALAETAEIVTCKIDGVYKKICRYPTPSFDLISESGNKCLEINPDADFVYMYKEDPNTNSTSWAFRSTDDRTDVGALATALDGGGHRNSSGAKTTDYLSKDLPCMTDIVVIPKKTTWFQFFWSPVNWLWSFIAPFGSYFSQKRLQ